MSYYIGPNVVTNNIQTCLDAGNEISYPKTGTVLNDLSNNRNSGSLINGPTFSTDYNGIILLDGIDDIIQSPINVAYSEGTISVWVYPKSNNNNNFFTYTADNGTSSWTHQVFITTSNKLKVYVFDGAVKSFDGTSTVEINKWHNIIFWWKNSDTYRCYFNGNLEGSRALTTAWTGGNKVIFGGSTGAVAGLSPTFLNGNISNIQIYNRALNSNEIIQNYNAFKSRFD